MNRYPPALALILLLAGCDEKAPDPDTLARGETARGVGSAAGRIVCAAPGSDGFARVCTLERASSERGTVLTIRRPDGGFHRLLVTQDGRGVIAADGAEPAKVTILDPQRIEVSIGGARYRLPARVGPVAR